MTFENYTAVKLLKPIYLKGKRVYSSPAISDIKNYCNDQISKLWDELVRFENPEEYYVDLSQKLWNTKNELLNMN